MKKYLFYDLEFANQYGGIAKICEFGYVLTDEKFNIIKSKEILIDPQVDQWDWWALENILHYSKKEYTSNLSLDLKEDEIRSVFAEADYVFGYSAASDAMCLNQDLKRYGLSYLDFNFIDVAIINKNTFDLSRTPALSDACINLGLQCSDNIHIAQVDATLTMSLLKKNLEHLNCSLDDYLIKNPDILDCVTDGNVKSVMLNRKRKMEMIDDLITGKHKYNDSHLSEALFTIILDNLEINNNAEESLYGKKVCISSNFEDYHFKDSINLAKLIYQKGGSYVKKVKSADIFVTFKLLSELNEEIDCKRLTALKNDNNHSTEIISFTDFLNKIGTPKDKLFGTEINKDWFIELVSKAKDEKILEIIKSYRLYIHPELSIKPKEENIRNSQEKSIWDIVKEKMF